MSPRRSPVLVAATAAIATAAAIALSGCGLGPGEGEKAGARVLVTRDFGATTVGAARASSLPAGETVMRLLQRRFTVQTRFGGGFVQSIQGVAGRSGSGRPIDWFFYVNGVESRRGAATSSVHAGDRIWWDRHDWGTAMSVPAVVGSFPEPFGHGTGGKRLPVRLECAQARAPACDEVARRLAAVGVVAGRSAPGSVSGTAVLRVLVGPWSAVGADASASRLERGPRASGVFARPGRGGRVIEVLDERGRTARTLGPGAGLVAATRAHDQRPAWLVTGTDDAGVMAAARSLRPATLAGRFALALAPDGAAVRVPLPGGAG